MLSASLILVSSLFLQPADVQQVKFPVTGLADQNGTSAVFSMMGSKASVVFFIRADCPVANRYAPEMARIAKDYGPKKVSFYRVYASPEIELSEAVKHGKDFGLTFPMFMDPSLNFVHAVGVTVTPEAALILADGTLAYRGRIDERTIEHGKERPNYRHDLRIALDSVLAGKSVELPRTAATGCFIEAPQ